MWLLRGSGGECEGAMYPRHTFLLCAWLSLVPGYTSSFLVM